MDKSLWIAGIIIALSAFGIKVGLAASSLVYNRTMPMKKKTKFMLIIFAAYLLLFSGIYFLISYFQLLSFFEQLLDVLNYGMLIHMIVAIGILIWGVRLVLQTEHQDGMAGHKGGALLLSLPCPICALVILITMTIAHSIFPIPLILVTLLLFGVFFGITLLTMVVLFPFKRKVEDAGPSFLGVVMITVSIYFLLTVIIAPIYQEAKDIYSLALKVAGDGSIDIRSLALLLTAVVLLLAFGFLWNYIREKRFEKAYST